MSLSVTIAACLLVVQFAAGSPLTFHSGSLPCDRLPINVRPTRYDLHLKFPSLDSDVYEGFVDIHVLFLAHESKKLDVFGLESFPCAAHYEKNVILMYADKSLEIQDMEVIEEPLLPTYEEKKEKLDIVDIIHDEAKQMMAIKVKQIIRASKHGTIGKISISFRGRMRDDKRGVYVSTYNDGEQVYKSIVSQFQPTDARTVFPCFDEPRFRVPFSVRVSHPKGLTAYGNAEVQQVDQEGELASTLFKATPSMPVHMVAFTVGQFDEPLETTSVRKGKERKVRVITAPGRRETGRFALEVAKLSLHWFERYIDYEFPLSKLDVVAVADHDKDNTESWGLAFVRDTLLSVDDETLPETRITVAVNVAHVVVHQWFGNLISAISWSDLWITEGVAAQFAFKAVQQIYTSFQSEYFVRLAALSGTMQADQSGMLHALSPSAGDLRTSEQIYAIFDSLEFMKSASLAQMIEETVGSPSYQSILRTFVDKHAFETFSRQDLTEAMKRLDGVCTLPDNDGSYELVMFTPKYVGVPVIDCQIVADNSTTNHLIKFDVIPFRKDLTGHEPQQVYIKIDSIVGSDDYTLQKQIITPSQYDQSNKNSRRLPSWFGLQSPKKNDFVNVDRAPSIATYYRTRYSADLYKRLEKAVELKLITAMDRIQILDDANQLVQADLIELAQFKSLLDSYADETDPAVVLAILTATGTYKRLAGDDSVFMPSDAAIVHMFTRYAFEVSGDERLIVQRARSAVLKSLIMGGDQAAINGGLEAFDRDGPKLALFLREPVYTAVVLSASERVNKLLDHLAETKSYEEKIRLVKALTLSKDKEVLQRVKLWLASSGLKPETTKPFLDSIEAGMLL